MALAVIGAGFGRTGTMSLKLALEQLGFGPCFHMREFFNGAKGETLQTKWERVAFGPDAPDWDDIFDGYSSTVDWPSCTFYRELAGHYPHAKVILTVRDPDRWYDSAAETIFSGRTSSEVLAKRTDPLGRMIHKLLSQGTFDGRENDRAHAIAVYNRHNAAVRQTIPPERCSSSSSAPDGSRSAPSSVCRCPTRRFPRQTRPRRSRPAAEEAAESERAE